MIDAPFPWFGGKRLIAAEVWERFGDVANYVEPFFGADQASATRTICGGGGNHMRSETCAAVLSAEQQTWQNAYCGFKRDFTGHDWCARFYRGALRDDGSIELCDCPCHQRKQGQLL